MIRLLYEVQTYCTSVPAAPARPGDADHSKVLGQASRILIAPFQRLPDDFVFVRAGELPQKSLATFLINERSERTALRIAPGVQLDRKVAVINAALKRWRIPQLLRVTDIRYRQQANKLVESGGAPPLQASGGAGFYNTEANQRRISLRRKSR